MTRSRSGNRVVLYLSSSTVSAWVFRRTRPADMTPFAHADASGVAFRTFLRHQQGARFFVLCDLPDERFLTDSIPYTWGRDRAALMSLRLQKHCPDTPFRSARTLRRSVGGRRDLQIQLHALGGAGVLQPWLDALDEAGVALCGVHTIAQAAGRLLRRLGRHHGPALLITPTRSGLRQIFTDHGVPRFCRLSSLHPDEDLGVACAGAARSVRDYLIAQRMLGREQALQLWLLVSQGSHAALATACDDDAGMPCGVIDADAQLRADGLRLADHVPFAGELLLARAIVMRPPRTQLAPDAHLRVARIRNAAGVTLLGGLCALAAGAGVAAHAFWTAGDLDARRQIVLRDADVLTRRAQQLSAELPATDHALDTLRLAAERHAQLQQRSTTPADLMQRLGSVLAELPDIRVTSLEWSLNSLPSVVADGLPPVAAELLMKATLPAPYASRPRQAQDLVDAARALLTQDGTTEVDIVRAPFDVDTRSLGHIDEGGPGFSLRVRRTLP